ncbi:MAG: hypothetical protein AAF805_02225 [Planctomycetota bacterium]
MRSLSSFSAALLLAIASPVAAADRYGSPPAVAPIEGASTEDAPMTPLAASAPTSGAGPTDEFATRMTALELALASTIAEPTAAWRLDALIAEAGELAGVADGDEQRRAARAVSTRLEGFAEIARRSRLAAAQPRARADGSDTVEGDAWRSPGRGAAEQSVAPRSYADRVRPATQPAPTTGVLRPVVSKRPDAPSFAVVNGDGQIAAFVTPKPEIKARLDALVGRRVSLRGSGDYRLDVPTRTMIADRSLSGGTRLR